MTKALYKRDPLSPLSKRPDVSQTQKLPMKTIHPQKNLAVSANSNKRNRRRKKERKKQNCLRKRFIHKNRLAVSANNNNNNYWQRKKENRLWKRFTHKNFVVSVNSNNHYRQRKKERKKETKRSGLSGSMFSRLLTVKTGAKTRRAVPMFCVPSWPERVVDVTLT